MKTLHLASTREECLPGSDFLLGLTLVLYTHVEFTAIGFLGTEILTLGAFFVRLSTSAHLVSLVER